MIGAYLQESAVEPCSSYFIGMSYLSVFVEMNTNIDHKPQTNVCAKETDNCLRFETFRMRNRRFV